MRLRKVLAACGLVLAAAIQADAAPDMTVEEARSVADLGLPSAPNLIRFSDREGANATGPSLTAFVDWAKTYPEQKQLLSLFPAYAEPVVTTRIDGLDKSRQERLQVYVAGARVLVDRPPGKVDLATLGSLATLTRIDAMIRHRPIGRDDAIPNRDPQQPYNRRPDRAWCEGAGVSCFESRYDLEGKLPLGIRLANKLEDGGKKIADHFIFQSEVRQVSPGELDAGLVSRLTGIATPVAGAFEQSIFHVNQVLRFGKMLAIVQPSPSDPGRSVVSVYLVLAVKADVLERKKEYERVPVLRNLVPAQVMMGTSSFNTGDSLSAGLPVYARNQVRALAALLARS